MNFSPSSTKSTSGCGADDPTPNVATALACDDTTDFLQTESMAIIATTSPEIKALNLHLRHHQHQPDNNINYNNYYGSSSRHPNKINLFPLSPPSGLDKATTEAEKEGEDKRPIFNLHDDDDKENHFQKEETTEDVTELFKKQTIYDDDDDDDSLFSSSLNVLGLRDTNRSHLLPPPSSLSSSSCGFHESSMTGMSIDLIGSPPSSTNDGMRRPKSDGHHTRVSSKRKPVHRRVSYDSLPSPKDIVETDNVMTAVVTPTFANTMDSLYDSNGNDLRSSTTTTQNPLKTNSNNLNNTRALGGGDYYSSPHHGHEEGEPAAAAATTRFSGSGPLFFPVDL
mmetsp:Transcript_44707/g.108410  ORF Transcript_44707/g.108410 Transcript_44707/m.108410 type:complete len:338 (+) Transcript_44707:459-1472(+)|eukprot:CAMPEP_0113474912 /NCGR_PEP_ID=MMETSP0014_2-20120614/18839_1 /TAXON_ID=2857 /ORGANISM="Nitzschia sp." /LENGTH=337 /DNA_ID=CAMNT_0000367795 /DNA_START=223 /DNA_END=1236 /DNA_ORIENTATION=- /assembly_acc=CAM_ASM_000159